jgi:hypothetical protein
MGYPVSEKRARSCGTWFVFIGLMLAAFLGIIYFDNLSTTESDNFLMPETCPAEVSKKEAT